MVGSSASSPASISSTISGCAPERAEGERKKDYERTEEPPRLRHADDPRGPASRSLDRGGDGADLRDLDLRPRKTPRPPRLRIIAQTGTEPPGDRALHRP